MFWKNGKTKTISTTVPQEMYENAKKKHWKHTDLWVLGYQIKEKNPVLDRVQEVEKREEERKKDYFLLRKRYEDLKSKIESLEGGKRD